LGLKATPNVLNVSFLAYPNLFGIKGFVVVVVVKVQLILPVHSPNVLNVSGI
jgi:hypothetical protein